MSIRRILSVLAQLRLVSRPLPPPSRRSSATADYEEAIVALRALKSLFEQELARRGDGEPCVGRERDDDAI